MPLPPALTPLRDALNDAPMPVALRALLIDSIKDFHSVADALVALRKQLVHTVNQENCALPHQGIHAIAGPSGAGKTMMVARIAQQASIAHSSEQVMVISFHDQRAGAWSQTQLLCAQSGVDCFRANNASTLKLLLEEHAGRKLILIDTPGVQMDDRLMDIRAIAQNVEFHAVIPADASAAVVRRVFESADNVWHSLMISKLDESSQPWALLQYLSDHRLAVSAASKGDQWTDLIQEMNLADLVQCALDGLGVEQQHPLNAIASSKLAEIAQRTLTETQQV
jgi:flagellar biosynthesis protein FlhF